MEAEAEQHSRSQSIYIEYTQKFYTRVQDVTLRTIAGRLSQTEADQTVERDDVFTTDGERKTEAARRYDSLTQRRDQWVEQRTQHFERTQTSVDMSSCETCSMYQCDLLNGTGREASSSHSREQFITSLGSFDVERSDKRERAKNSDDFGVHVELVVVVWLFRMSNLSNFLQRVMTTFCATEFYTARDNMRCGLHNCSRPKVTQQTRLTSVN